MILSKHTRKVRRIMFTVRWKEPGAFRSPNKGEPVESMMGRKCGFFLINGVQRNLPVTAVAVQCSKDNGLSEGVYTLVHAR
jgi:hypothetical protein